MSCVADALDRIVRREDDFASVLADLYQRQHTGTVLLHFVDGVAKKVEFPGVQVTLIQGRLDTPADFVQPT
jgi:hypothetical protein